MPKLPVTHKQPKEFGFQPSCAHSLISQTTTPFHWESCLHPPKPVIPVFGAVLSGSLYGALLTFVRSLSFYGVKVTGVFMTLFHSLHVKFSCIYIHIITYSIYVFSRENGGGGGGGDELSLRFILFLLHGLWGEFRLCVTDSPVWGSFSPVLLRRRLRHWPRHTWMFLLRFNHLQDEYYTVTRHTLFLVSSAHYILLFVARCAYGGRGGKLFNCTQWGVNILRHFHRLLLIILLLPSP